MKSSPKVLKLLERDRRQVILTQRFQSRMPKEFEMRIIKHFSSGAVVMLIGAAWLSSGEFAASASEPCAQPPSVPTFTLPKELTDTSCKLFQASAAEVKELIKSKLKPRIHKLDREVYFYHYGRYGFPSAGKGCPTVDPDEMINIGGKEVRKADYYFKEAASSLYDKRDYQAGLYTAADPLTSIDYSREPGVLLRVGVPAGVSYTDEDGIPLSAEEGMTLYCYMRAQCQQGDCNSEKFAYILKETFNPGILVENERGETVEKPVTLTLNPSVLVLSSKASGQLVRDVYRELNVAFNVSSYRDSPFGECGSQSSLQAVFAEPDFSSKFETTLLTPCLEAHPSEQKKKLYGEMIQFWNAYDLHGSGAKLEGDEKFWDYYRAWAPVLYSLPKGTDLKAFQAEQSAKLRKSGRRQLTGQIFGCSKAHRATEVLSAGE